MNKFQSNFNSKNQNSRNSEYFLMNKINKYSNSSMKGNFKTFKHKSKLKNKENVNSNVDSTFIDDSRDDSHEEDLAEDVNSYFNIEIKSRKDKRTVVYSNIDTEHSRVKSPLIINQTSINKKTPIGYSNENTYKNIKWSPRKRWITPNLVAPFKPKLPSVNNKGVVPAMPQK